MSHLGGLINLALIPSHHSLGWNPKRDRSPVQFETFDLSLPHDPDGLVHPGAVISGISCVP